MMLITRITLYSIFLDFPDFLKSILFAAEVLVLSLSKCDSTPLCY